MTRSSCLVAAALVAACGAALVHAKAANDTGRPNVLFFVVDNLRPSLGSYGIKEVSSPHTDAFSKRPGTTLFSRAYCQVAWCAPSRNSFLSGRTPDQTKSWNFVNNFRQAGPDWTTLPGYFKDAGYYATSMGKVFHLDLPPNFDYPQSWSDKPFFRDKPTCPNNTMSCMYEDGDLKFDVDTETIDVAVQRLKDRPKDQPMFMAVGLQSPRLPWTYPKSAAEPYPSLQNITIAKHPESPAGDQHEWLEWFRPTEIDWFEDIHNSTHEQPVPLDHQHVLRRAYYATITHIDRLFGRMLDALDQEGLTNNTVVLFVADHGQNLGEHNMWSMMNLLESSLRVPMLVHVPPPLNAQMDPVSTHRPTVDFPVQLTDLYPTLAGLAGLPDPPVSWKLEGINLAPYLKQNASKPAPGRDAAFGQITRCYNCTLAYANSDPGYRNSCHYDAVADQNYTVPCCKTPRTLFDWMGMTVRTSQWRFTTWCPWDGGRLMPDFAQCARDADELFDHRNDSQLYNVDDVENSNVAGDPSLRHVVSDLFQRIVQQFSEW